MTNAPHFVHIQSLPLPTFGQRFLQKSPIELPLQFPYAGAPRPSGPEPQKVSKWSSRASRNGMSKKSPNTDFVRSRPGKPNQRKGQNEKFMNFAHFCEFWCFSLGKQARFTLNFCSRTPLRKVHELAFLWFGLPG